MSYSQNLEVQELEGNILTIPAEIDTLKPYVLGGKYFKYSDGSVLTTGLGGRTIQFLTKTPPGISEKSIEWDIIREIKVPDNCKSVYRNAPVWKDHYRKIGFEQSSSDSIKEDKAYVRKLKFMLDDERKVMAYFNDSPLAMQWIKSMLKNSGSFSQYKSGLERLDLELRHGNYSLEVLMRALSEAVELGIYVPADFIRVCKEIEREYGIFQ